MISCVCFLCVKREKERGRERDRQSEGLLVEGSRTENRDSEQSNRATQQKMID